MSIDHPFKGAPDIAVVGAGIVGLGIAWQLARRGMRPLVLERHEPGSGASRAAAGMLAPTAEVRFEEVEALRLGQQSLAMYPDFVARLEAASGMSVDYRTEGTLVVGVDRDDALALDHLWRYHQELGLGVKRLRGEEARELEPGLSPTIHNAVFIPDNHQVDPRRMIQALVRALEAAGGQVRSGAEVRGLLSHPGANAGELAGVVLADGEEIEVPRVLVASGAWTRELQGLPAKERPHVRPVRGQMLSLDMGPVPLCRHVVRSPDAYLVPKGDGRLVVGATMEEVGWDARLTAGGVFELLRGAWETLPAIYDAPILEMWTGFRPMTLNNLPVMRASKALRGLWYAVGHGRGGILLAPLTAEAMAQAICEESPHTLEALARGIIDNAPR